MVNYQPNVVSIDEKDCKVRKKELSLISFYRFVDFCYNFLTKNSRIFRQST